MPARHAQQESYVQARVALVLAALSILMVPHMVGPVVGAPWVADGASLTAGTEL